MACLDWRWWPSLSSGDSSKARITLITTMKARVSKRNYSDRQDLGNWALPPSLMTTLAPPLLTSLVRLSFRAFPLGYDSCLPFCTIIFNVFVILFPANCTNTPESTNLRIKIQSGFRVSSSPVQRCTCQEHHPVVTP